MIDEALIGVLFPQLAMLRVSSVDEREGAVIIRAATGDWPAQCPACGVESQRVHARYERVIADLAVGGRPVVIRLSVRRLVCAAAACERRSFAEQVAGLTFRHGRRSVLARQALIDIACALAGRAGARLAGRLCLAAGKSTLLRLLHGLTIDNLDESPQVLGVDDFALKRGHLYGSIVLDMQTRRPVDVLPDRTAETFAKWLAEHVGAQIVCRDGSATYAAAINAGAPNAVQVSDRWHLWHHLGQAVEKMVIRHRASLRPPVEPAAASGPDLALPDKPVTRLAARHHERFEAIHQLLADGLTRTAICHTLRLDLKTVSKFADAVSVEHMLRPKQYGKKVDTFAEHILRRWAEGCTSAPILHTEIRALGFRGTERTVRRWVQPLRAGITPPAPSVLPAKARNVVRWMMTDPDNLQPDDKQCLDDIVGRSPALHSTMGHVHGFAKMMKNLTGQHLPQWMDRVLADDVPDLHTFVASLKRDLAAVIAGLTLPWSSGTCEGHVNRVKMLKRQMFGRASFSLLRKRILLAN